MSQTAYLTEGQYLALHKDTETFFQGGVTFLLIGFLFPPLLLFAAYNFYLGIRGARALNRQNALRAGR